jgi:hypothetical protein
MLPQSAGQLQKVSPCGGMASQFPFPQSDWALATDGISASALTTMAQIGAAHARDLRDERASGQLHLISSSVMSFPSSKVWAAT